MSSERGKSKIHRPRRKKSQFPQRPTQHEFWRNLVNVTNTSIYQKKLKPAPAPAPAPAPEVFYEDNFKELIDDNSPAVAKNTQIDGNNQQKQFTLSTNIQQKLTQKQNEPKASTSQPEQKVENKSNDGNADNQELLAGVKSDLKQAVQEKVTQVPTAGQTAVQEKVTPVQPVGQTAVQERVTPVQPVGQTAVQKKVAPVQSVGQTAIQEKVTPVQTVGQTAVQEKAPEVYTVVKTITNRLGPPGIPKSFLTAPAPDPPPAPAPAPPPPSPDTKPIPTIQRVNNYPVQQPNPMQHAPQMFAQVYQQPLPPVLPPQPVPQHPQFNWNPPMEPMVMPNMPMYSPAPVEAPLDIYGSITDIPQAYSPSDVYDPMDTSGDRNDEIRDGSESPYMLHPETRLSAFKRLGPLTETKKPKLTINLSFNKEQSVREVVAYVPVHEREDIINSTNEIIQKYLPVWPWKNPLRPRRTATVRHSMVAMLLEKEQMEESYDKNNCFIMISVTGYPETWTKEDVLDTLLENLKDKSFIPCFIEFTREECKFFVLRNKFALLAIHSFGFKIHKDGVDLIMSISISGLSLNQISFIPGLVLRKVLVSAYTDEFKLDLSAFTLGNDISHFIYFPLNRTLNQTKLVQMQSEVIWRELTELDLSNNRLETLEGFDFQSTMPRLRSLNLANNYLTKITVLLSSRDLPIRSLVLEGNPLCTDYTDPDRYIMVVRMLFPGLRELDGIPIRLSGEMPKFKRYYVPEFAAPVVEKFLDIYIPLLECDRENKPLIQNLYDDDAILTITYRPTLKYNIDNSILQHSRVLLEGDIDAVLGSSAIVKLMRKWPPMEHDRTTFVVDVLHHNDTSTILQFSGVLKLTSMSLAEDETSLGFTRTLHLVQKHDQYKIRQEMLYWNVLAKDVALSAFRLTTVSGRHKPKPTLAFETPPDDTTKSQLVNIFMQLTELERKPSERCLEEKNWNIKQALEYFVKLLKLDEINILLSENPI